MQTVCGDRPWHLLDVVTGCCKFVNFLSREYKAVINPVMLSDPICFAEFIFKAPDSFFKAGDGNRTHVSSLEGWGFTIKLHPRG